MIKDNKAIAKLHDLLDYNAQKFTAAEVALNNSLPFWIAQANSIKLKNVLQKYQEIVQQHVKKFELFIEEEKILSLSLADRIMQALIEETNEKLNQCSDAEVRDACLLSSIQIINHLKISLYGTAAAFARTLEIEKFSAMFHEAEINEKQVDDRLSQLAEHEINGKAKAPLVLPQ